MIINALQTRNADGMIKKFHCTYCSAIVTIMEEDGEFKDRSTKSKTIYGNTYLFEKRIDISFYVAG